MEEDFNATEELVYPVPPTIKEIPDEHEEGSKCCGHTEKTDREIFLEEMSVKEKQLKILEGELKKEREAGERNIKLFNKRITELMTAHSKIASSIVLDAERTTLMIKDMANIFRKDMK